MKKMFIQFRVQPTDTGAGSGSRPGPDQQLGGGGNAEGSGANEQAKASRGGEDNANSRAAGEPQADTKNYPRTGFETATSSGRNEKTEDEARTTTQPDYKPEEAPTGPKQ